jgi:hypothetical protein
MQASRVRRANNREMTEALSPGLFVRDYTKPLPKSMTRSCKGVDRRDVHRSFSTTARSASRNYSANIPSVNAFRQRLFGQDFEKLTGIGIMSPYLPSAYY